MMIMMMWYDLMCTEKLQNRS